MSLVTKVSRLLHPEVARDKAVNTTIFLVLFAFCVGLAIPLGVPPLLSFLEESTPESTKALVGLIISLLSPLLLTLFSWDRITSTVNAAINAAAEEEVENFKNNNSLSSIHEKLNSEFESVIFYLREQISYPQPSQLLNHRNYLSSAKQSLAQYDVLTILWEQDDLLKAMALKACMEACNIRVNRYRDVERNIPLKDFRKDIYIYLKTWLLYSIKENSEMSLNALIPSFSDVDLINKWTYIDAVKYIRDELVDDQKVTSLLNKEYLEESKEILKEYLTKLVNKLEKEL